MRAMIAISDVLIGRDSVDHYSLSDVMLEKRIVLRELQRRIVRRRPTTIGRIFLRNIRASIYDIVVWGHDRY